MASSLSPRAQGEGEEAKARRARTATESTRQDMALSPRLSVNINKVALLRNSRHTGVPDVASFARRAHEAGADGITVHPRPDERHIRRSDVPAIATVMAPWRPAFELNVEGYPEQRLIDIVREVRPEQVTLVPDPPEAFTSEEGWRLDHSDLRVVQEAVATFKALGARVVLFLSPDPDVVAQVPATGADGIEIYTGAYAAAFITGKPDAERAAAAETYRRARALGLMVNIGHDLNLANLPPLMAQMPQVHEASIGHELTADALVMGFAATIQAYKVALAGRR